MRILQVTPYFYPAWTFGGPVKAVYELSKELVKKGHDVTVYTTDICDRTSSLDVKSDGPIQVDGIRTYYFRNISKELAYDYKLFLCPTLVPVIRKEISRFDILHLHEYYTFQNVVTHYFAKKCHVPYVLSTRGSLCPVVRKQKARFKQVFAYLFGRNLLQDVSVAIALTREERRQLLLMGLEPDKVRVIPNGVNLLEFADLPKKGIFRQKYLIGSDETIILFLSRITRKKGLDLLINVFSRLVEQLRGLRLVIAGPADLDCLASLKRLIATKKIEDKVLFTGLLVEKKKLSAYVDADVFVLPSYSEGLPLAVLEACASGVPVVITDRCNIPEVAHYKAGFVVGVNEEEIQNAVFTVLNDEKIKRELGSNGRKMVREKFTLTKVVEQLEELYREAGHPTS